MAMEMVIATGKAMRSQQLPKLELLRITAMVKEQAVRITTALDRGTTVRVMPTVKIRTAARLIAVRAKEKGILMH